MRAILWDASLEALISWHCWHLSLQYWHQQILQWPMKPTVALAIAQLHESLWLLAGRCVHAGGIWPRRATSLLWLTLPRQGRPGDRWCSLYSAMDLPSQAGWSNLRRGDYQSNWSNTSPVSRLPEAFVVDVCWMCRSDQMSWTGWVMSSYSGNLTWLWKMAHLQTRPASNP